MKRALVALILLAALLSMPAQAFAAQAEYAVEQLSTELYVETDASVHAIERRTVTFEKAGDGLAWQLCDLNDDAEVVISSVRVATLDAEGAMEGEWVAPEVTFDDVDCMLSCDFPTEARTYLVEVDYQVLNYLLVYRDSGDLRWRYAQSSMPVDVHDASLRVALPVPAGAEVLPDSNVRAWGHGPGEGTFSIGEDGVVSYYVALVPAGHYAEAHVLFPSYWIDNLAADSPQRQAAAHRQAAISSEEDWVDQSARASIWDNKVRVFFLTIACIAVLAAVAVALAFGETPRTRRWFVRIAATLGITALAEQAFFREPITTFCLCAVAAAVVLLATLMPSSDDWPIDDEGSAQSALPDE